MGDGGDDGGVDEGGGAIFFSLFGELDSGGFAGTLVGDEEGGGVEGGGGWGSRRLDINIHEFLQPLDVCPFGPTHVSVNGCI